MTISKYLQKNAAEQDTASNTTLSRQNPTVLPYLSQNRLWSLLNKRQRTSPKNLWGNCSGKASASYFRQCCY